MSIFDAYNAEYTALSRDIAKNIAELRAYENSNEKTSSLTRHIEALFSQEVDLMKQMDIEVRSQDAGTRKILLEKVSQFKKSTLSLKSEFDRAKEKFQRSSLIGEKSAEQRQRMLDTNDKITRQNETIASAIRTVAETEEVGIEIMSELERNRAKIDNARDRAREFTGITDSARRLITQMQRRDTQQKMILTGLACIIVAAIIVAIYYGTTGSSSSSSTSTSN